MSLTIGLGHRQTLVQRPALAQLVGETSGDIPMYSLHRIRKMIQLEPPEIGPDLTRWLAGSFVQANQEYRAETGRRWACLTSNNVVSAFGDLERRIGQAVEVAEASMAFMPKVSRRAVIQRLTDQQGRAVGLAKRWFEERSERLIYDMGGQIPWAVVCRLRQGLGLWILGLANPFVQPIDEFVLAVASQDGQAAESAEDAWEAMGGRVFTEVE